LKTYAFWKIPGFIIQIIPGITITIEYVVFSFIFGALLGGLLALMKLSGKKFPRAIAYGYTTVMRCTPAIVMLFLVYYGVPQLVRNLTGYKMDTTEKIGYVIVTLTLFNAANLSEVFRSSYLSLDKTQVEAAKSVGMTGIQSFVHVLFPQMFKSMLPNLSNTVLMTLKNGSLAFTIGLMDVLGMGQKVIGKNVGAWVVETDIAMIAIYWPIALIITKLTGVLERNYSFEHGKKAGGRRK